MKYNLYFLYYNNNNNNNNTNKIVLLPKNMSVDVMWTISHGFESTIKLHFCYVIKNRIVLKCIG